MLGGNLPENREQELKLFTNEEVIAVNQTGETPRQLFKTDSSMAWYSHVSGTKNIYLALFNLKNDSSLVSVNLESLGIKGKISIRDLWKKEDLGSFKKGFNSSLEKHSAGLFKLSYIN